MVPSNEEGDGGSDSTPKSRKGKSQAAASKMSVNVEKDSEEYRKLRERNNEAVKKSRTRTRIRTQNTLDKVEKLRTENTKLEDRIDGLKKELDLLKELFVSHAGTKSMKRLTEVDLDVLLAEAAPNSKKSKRNSVPYTGRDRDQIEREVQLLLGQQPEADSDEEAQPSTSREAEAASTEVEEQSTEVEEQTDDRPHSSEPSASEENAMVEQSDTIQMEQVEEQITETYTIIDDGTGPAVWTTENGEAVVVTIEGEDGTVQQDLHDIIQGEILMLE